MFSSDHFSPSLLLRSQGNITKTAAVPHGLMGAACVRVCECVCVCAYMHLPNTHTRTHTHNHTHKQTTPHTHTHTQTQTSVTCFCGSTSLTSPKNSSKTLSQQRPP